MPITTNLSHQRSTFKLVVTVKRDAYGNFDKLKTRVLIASPHTHIPVPNGPHPGPCHYPNSDRSFLLPILQAGFFPFFLSLFFSCEVNCNN